MEPTSSIQHKNDIIIRFLQESRDLNGQLKSARDFSFAIGRLYQGMSFRWVINRHSRMHLNILYVHWACPVMVLCSPRHLYFEWWFSYRWKLNYRKLSSNSALHIIINITRTFIPISCLAVWSCSTHKKNNWLLCRTSFRQDEPCWTWFWLFCVSFKHWTWSSLREL